MRVQQSAIKNLLQDPLIKANLYGIPEMLLTSGSFFQLTMNEQEIIEQTAVYVREKMSGEGSGHDWWHVYRVWRNSIHIAINEEADMIVVELAALLHDIADWKFNDGDIKEGPRQAREWLKRLGVDEAVISHVSEIVGGISFKGAGVTTHMRTIEGKVVQDADRLDAIGAIGIARTFAYGGHLNHEIYNPEKKPVMHNTFEEYKNGKGSVINHFYEKLLLLKDLMNTETAKRIAMERHSFMEQFLDKFFREWEGKE